MRVAGRGLGLATFYVDAVKAGLLRMVGDSSRSEVGGIELPPRRHKTTEAQPPSGRPATRRFTLSTEHYFSLLHKACQAHFFLFY